jgi:FdhD protein
MTPQAPLRRSPVERLAPSSASREDDTVIVEEPLEIRIAGDTLAVTMRTPGHDRELALGFLVSEGIVRSIDDVGSVAHCGRTGDEGRFNTIDVTPAPGVALDIDKTSAARRGTLTTAACGVCGRLSIDDLLARCGRLPDHPLLRRADIVAAQAALTRAQPLFARSGGCHGAAIVRFDGTLVATFEDVGRHNAVDKVVGSQLLARALPLSGHILMVSGRVSFEIIQKAIMGGIPVVAGVSAASSLAIDLAVRGNVTLAGFVRGESIAVYAGRVGA